MQGAEFAVFTPSGCRSPGISSLNTVFGAQYLRVYRPEKLETLGCRVVSVRFAAWASCTVHGVPLAGVGAKYDLGYGVHRTAASN